VTLLGQSPDHVEFTLTGQRLHGPFTLRRGETGRWELRRT